MGKIIWLMALLLFILLDILFMPIYLAAKALEAASDLLYGISDEGGMGLTKTWMKKTGGLFATKKQ
jgi:hypothetical protein